MFLIDTETRKRIIEQFATKHKLDVSNKEEWTLVPGSLIDSDKVCLVIFFEIIN